MNRPETQARYGKIIRGVRIELILSDGYVDIVGEGLDLALRFGPTEDSTLRVKGLGTSRQVLCAAPVYIDTYGAPTVPADLKKHNCLVRRYGQKLDNVWRFSRDATKQIVTVSGDRLANDGALVRQWGLKGYGVIQKLELDVGPDIQAGRLVELLPDYALPPIPYQTLFPPARAQPRRVQAFAKYLVETLEGTNASLRDFEASLVEPLSQAHRVIAIDRPGHGYSERPNGEWPDPAEQARLIHELLREIDADTPLLVGHSWSGSVVLAYLLAYPEAASGGVLLAGGSHPWEGGVAWYNDLARVPVLGELFAWTIAFPIGRLALDAGIEQVFDPNPVPEDYKDNTGVELSLRPHAFLANAEDVQRLSDFLAVQSRRYGEIEHPLLLFTGADDDIVPAWNHADRLEGQVDRIERIDLQDTGHALHHARAEQVAAAIGAFSDQFGIE